MVSIFFRKKLNLHIYQDFFGVRLLIGVNPPKGQIAQHPMLAKRDHDSMEVPGVMSRWCSVHGTQQLGQEVVDSSWSGISREPCYIVNVH